MTNIQNIVQKFGLGSFGLVTVWLAAPNLGCKTYITYLLRQLLNNSPSLGNRRTMLGTVFICKLIRGNVDSPDLVKLG